jgi:SAM-dependent methyltransferase
LTACGASIAAAIVTQCDASRLAASRAGEGGTVKVIPDWTAADQADNGGGASSRAARPFGFPLGPAADSLRALHAILKRRLPPATVSIYEAGGGSISFLPPELLARSRVTVVDLDPVQIDNNRFADTLILGDIQIHRLPPQSVDLVVCYNVIEHLPDVRAALERFLEALRPGGLILIGAPNPHSLSGWVTRFSPHWFHVLYYRWIRGEPAAGTPGHAPFRTFYHPLVSPRRLARFAAANRLEMVYERRYESPRYAEMRLSHPRLAALVDAGAAVLNALLLRRTDVREGDYHVVLRMPAA